MKRPDRNATTGRSVPLRESVNPKAEGEAPPDSPTGLPIGLIPNIGKRNDPIPEAATDGLIRQTPPDTGGAPEDEGALDGGKLWDLRAKFGPLAGESGAEESDGDPKVPTGLPIGLIPNVGKRSDPIPEAATDGLIRQTLPDTGGTPDPDGEKQSEAEAIRAQRLRPSLDVFADLRPSTQGSEGEGALDGERLGELRAKFRQLAEETGSSEFVSESPRDYSTAQREAVETRHSLVAWDRVRQWHDSRRLWSPPVITLLAVTLVVFLVTMWKLGTVAETNGPATAAIATPDTAELRSWDEVAPKVKSAVSGFIEAKSWEERLAFICSPERLREQVRDYYENQKPPALTLGKFKKILPLMMGDVPFYFVAFEDETYVTQYVDVYELDGTFKLNWESLVAYGSMPWSRFCEERPTAPQNLRVYAMPVDFHSFEFSDREKYEGYRITHRSGAPDLYGYVERGSLAAHEIRRFSRASHTQPMHLSLAFPKESTRQDCVLITSFIHNLWARVDEFLPLRQEAMPPETPKAESAAPSAKDQRAQSRGEK